MANYHINILRLESSDFKNLDHDIQEVLSLNGIHMQPACKKRLYLPRDELRRGLHSVAAKAELTMLQIWETLSADADISTRRAVIVTCETN